MNKVVREHFPVSKLPEELRQAFADFETVTLVGERDNPEHTASERASYHDYDEMMADIKPMTLRELLEDRKAHPEKYRGNVTIEEAVAHVRALRDEWDSDR